MGPKHHSKAGCDQVDYSGKIRLHRPGPLEVVIEQVSQKRRRKPYSSPWLVILAPFAVPDLSDVS